MRLNQPRWIVTLTLLAVAPLVVLGVSVVQRLTAVNEQRYEQEVVAARYAAELTADEIVDDIREHFRPWRESLAYAHGKGETYFRAKLQKMYLTSSLVDVLQFVDTETIVADDAFGDQAHVCAAVVKRALRVALVEEGRARLGYDPEKKKAKRTSLFDDDDLNREASLRWIHVDRHGPICEGCPDCAEALGRMGALVDDRRFALLIATFPLPGGDDMTPGLFGAVVPRKNLMREIVVPAFDRWQDGQDALPRHGLRMVAHDGTFLLPEDGDSVLRKNEALYAQAVLGEGAPWKIEIVALSGFDLAQLRAENGRWSFGITAAALALIVGALLFARSFLHEIESARLRRHLLSNVSHELKTPLSLIRLYTETLETGRARTDEDRQRFLGIIGREAKRLTHLIDNLLDVQRIEDDRKQYAFAQVRPDRVVRDTVEAYRYHLTEEGFTLRLDVDDDLPLVYLDEEAMAQALINLLDNAAKYSDTTKEIAVRVAASPNEVCFSVQDRGIGIPAREQQKIFESFYRVEKSDVHDVKGSGLGLAVVAHVARAHGGRVDVDSTPGRGSTFTICISTSFEPS